MDAQDSPAPGHTAAMPEKPDHGEDSYRGCGRLEGMTALITGGDSGIGRAVAIAYAREGADVAISYLNEEEDAQETERHIKEAGRRCLLLPGDICDPAHCDDLIERTVETFGGIDILVNNAAHQAWLGDIEEISDFEWHKTVNTNLSATFWLSRAALRHMGRGASIINTTSINADKPNPHLLAYATTKGAIRNFTTGLAQLVAARGIRVNCVAPGPIWTPLINATMPPDQVRDFGKSTPMGRPGQPVDLVSTFVMLAEPLSAYVSGATVAVTGGTPFL